MTSQISSRSRRPLRAATVREREKTAPLRSRLVVVFASLALTLLAIAGFSLASDPDAQPKAEPPTAKAPDKPARPQEDEEPDARPVKNHKVAGAEGDEQPAPNTASAPAPRVDLKQAARDAKKTPVHNLFQELAVPHDVMTRELPGVSIQNIVPIPDHIGKNSEGITEPFKVTPFLRNSWVPGDPIEVKKNTITSIKSYEEVALTAADAFLRENYQASRDPDSRMTRYEQDVAAEQVLTSVLSGLQSDRRTGRRVGGPWQEVEDRLTKRLFAVLLEELNLLVKTPDWDPAFALTKRLAATYTTRQEQDEIAKPLAGVIHTALIQALDDKQKVEARKRLVLMEELFPNNKALDDSAEILRKQAQNLIAEARREMEANPKNEHIGKLLNEIQELAPNEPDLHLLQSKLNKEHPTLRVGVRELPVLMSPALAGSDSELRAVELMFESLVKLHPDGEGGSRWEPGLSEGPPRMTPRGRQFQLAADGRWSNGERITAGDVRETVSLLRAGKIAARPPVWGELLDPVVVGEASRVNLTLRQGWLDPLALMNFKILPSGSTPDSAAFASHPLGSGPFVYAENIKTDNGRPCVVFTANPYYSARPGKAGLPRIKEVHFILYTDAVAEMNVKGGGRCDLMLDLTAKEAADLQAKAADLRQPPVAATNRRIYFLAVNHRNSVLASAAFRRALAYAVNRDKLLNDAFRTAPGQKLHTPLNGPYPVKSWAGNPALTDPFNIERAKTNMVQAGKEGVHDPSLTLKYPAGDPAVEKAMKELCEQVNATIPVTLKPLAVPPAELRHDVETTYSYDLAYYHYDFPDDVYWLGPLLDPRGGPGGQNYLGYSSGKLITQIQDISRRRDFPEVRSFTHILHDNFLKDEMPFIPLWQLDALSAVNKRVEIPQSDLLFDPVRVFTDVERWRLK